MSRQRLVSALHSPWFLLTAVFVASRLLYALAGVRFDSEPFSTFWQYADSRAIRSDPIGSFVHLHIQPPLFNLVLAAAGRLALAGVPLTLTLHSLFIGLGHVLAASSFALGQRLGLTRRQALVTALVITCNPVTLLYENHLFYTYPTAVLLVVAALLATRYASSRRSSDAVLFFVTLAAVIFTRSVYHLLWFLVAGLILLLLASPDRRRVVAFAAAVPLLVVLALYVKNLFLFDEFTTSSWFGMNLAKATTFQVDVQDRMSLVRHGKLSPLALRRPFEYYALYADLGYGTPPAKPTGHPVLDNPLRSNNSPNFNYKGYLGIYRQYRKDALASLRLRPGEYLEGQAIAHLTYLNSPANFFAGGQGAGARSARNYDRISPLNAVWRTAVYGQVPPRLTASARRGRSELVRTSTTIGVFTALALAAVVLAGLRTLVSVLRRRHPCAPPIVGIMFAWATILYVTVVANALDVGENNRFRYEVEPLLFILVACLLFGSWPASRDRLQRARDILRRHRKDGQAPEQRGQRPEGEGVGVAL